MRRLLVAARLGLLGLIIFVGLASVGSIPLVYAASQQSQPKVQPFQISDQHGSMLRVEPSAPASPAAQNTLIYFYRGDW
jgi:hypothetical protein